MNREAMMYAKGDFEIKKNGTYIGWAHTYGKYENGPAHFVDVQLTGIGKLNKLGVVEYRKLLSLMAARAVKWGD